MKYVVYVGVALVCFVVCGIIGKLTDTAQASGVATIVSTVVICNIVNQSYFKPKEAKKNEHEDQSEDTP